MKTKYTTIRFNIKQNLKGKMDKLHFVKFVSKIG